MLYQLSSGYISLVHLRLF